MAEWMDGELKLGQGRRELERERGPLSGRTPSLAA